MHPLLGRPSVKTTRYPKLAAYGRCSAASREMVRESTIPSRRQCLAFPSSATRVHSHRGFSDVIDRGLVSQAAAGGRGSRRSTLAEAAMVPIGQSSHRTYRGNHLTNTAVVYRHVRLRAAAQLRWQEQGTLVAKQLIGDRRGASHAAYLLRRTLAASTQGNYQRLWESFAECCSGNGELTLPANPELICCYLGYLLTVRGRSIRPYVAAIGSQHRRHGLQDPTKHPLVMST